MINKKYSFKDFMGVDLTKVDSKELNNTEIVGSCFWQENSPKKQVFPPTMTGVIFRRCNLDNCVIPDGNTVEPDCTNKQIKIFTVDDQNNTIVGGEDWIVDDALEKVEKLHSANQIADQMVEK